MSVRTGGGGVGWGVCGGGGGGEGGRGGWCPPRLEPSPGPHSLIVAAPLTLNTVRPLLCRRESFHICRCRDGKSGAGAASLLSVSKGLPKVEKKKYTKNLTLQFFSPPRRHIFLNKTFPSV